MKDEKRRNEVQEEGLIRYQFFGIKDMEYAMFIPEDLQLEIVRQNKNEIMYITDPTDKVIKEAFDGDLEKGMKEIELFRSYSNNYKYLNEAPEEVQLAEVSESESKIIHIQNPSEQVQLAAIEKRYNAVKLIRNPTEKVQKLAITNYINSLSGLRFVTPIEKTIEILKEKLSDPKVEEEYVVDFLQCVFIIGDKLEFIDRYGSKKAKIVGMKK